MFRCYCIDRTVLQKELIQCGWLQVSERTPKPSTHKDNRSGLGVSSESFQGVSSEEESSECVSKSEHTRLWKRLTVLKTKNKIGFNRKDVWLTKAVTTA